MTNPLYVLSACAMLTCFGASAQNYHVANPNHASRFWPDEPFELEYMDNPSHRYIRGLRWVAVDTLAQGIRLTPNAEILPWNLNVLQSTGCHNPATPAWIGPQVLLGSGNIDYQFNRDGDSIPIHRMANVGDTWTCWTFPTGNTVQAEVTAHTLGAALGVPDSVKTIELQVLTSGGQSVAHNLNGVELQLSQGHGWLQTLNWRDFPGFQYSVEVTGHALIGLTNPTLGVHQLTRGEVFDFNIGDVFHYHLPTEVLAGGSDVIETNQYRSREIIGKLVGPDSVRYIAQTYTWGTKHVGWDFSPYLHPVYAWLFEDSFDTLTYHNLSDPVIADALTGNGTIALTDLMPLEPIAGIQSLDNYTAYMEDDLYNGRTVERALAERFVAVDSCFYVDYFDEFDQRYDRFIAGCGSLRNFIRHGSMAGSGSWLEELVYFQKGTETWGTPYSIPLGIQAPENPQSRLQLYPNPTNGTVHFANFPTGNSTLEVNALDGRLILSEPLTSPTIDLSHLPQGMYVLRIVSASTTQIGKVLVR